MELFIPDTRQTTDTRLLSLSFWPGDVARNWTNNKALKMYANIKSRPGRSEPGRRSTALSGPKQKAKPWPRWPCPCDGGVG